MGNIRSSLNQNSAVALDPDIRYNPSYCFRDDEINRLKNTKSIEIEYYDKYLILDEIKKYYPEYYDISTIILNTSGFSCDNIKQIKDIHFINSFNDSLLHIHNKNGKYTKTALNVKITNESLEEIQKIMKERLFKKKIVNE